MYKKLENLHKLLSVLYPDNAEQIFNEKIERIFDIFMSQRNFSQSPKDSSLYIEQKVRFFEPKQFTKPIIELFEQSFKHIKLFEKKRKTLRLRYSLIDTINVIAKQDKYIQEILDTECKKIKDDIKQKVAQEQYDIYESKKEKNDRERGPFYAEEFRYNGPTKINLDKICLVHTTNFYPVKNKKGQYVIETTAHATNYLLPRATVHFACNHIVEEHIEGAHWSKMPYVIIAPLKDVVKINGAPRRFGLVDTYFLPDQESGLVLPESVMIVEPGKKMPENKLFIVAPNNHVYYRDKNFSDQMKRKLAGEKWESVTDKELMIMSKQLATEEIMNFNGFNYLHGHMLDNYDMHQSFYTSGQSNGFDSASSKYVHINDYATFLSGQYENIVPILQAILDKKQTSSNNNVVKEIAEDWLREYIIEGKPLKKMQTSENDPEQIKVVKEKYNLAIEELKKHLSKKIKTKGDIATFLSKEESKIN